MGKQKRFDKSRERPADSAAGSATGGEETTNAHAWTLRVIVKEGFLDKAKAAGKHQWQARVCMCMFMLLRSESEIEDSQEAMVVAEFC